jgi:hypothetical protein
MLCDPCPRLMLQLRAKTVRVGIRPARYPQHLHIAVVVWLRVGGMAAPVEAAALVPAPAADTKLPILKEI